MKTCFKCGDKKPLSSFYRHPEMVDGRVNKCKECNKIDVRENRMVKVEYYRAYDRARGNRQGYQYTKEYRERYPNKYRAHAIVNSAIKRKKLFSQPCDVCGSEETQAHHDDYFKPLNVRWMCAAHHSQWHKQNGEGLNAR